MVLTIELDGIREIADGLEAAIKDAVTVKKTMEHMGPIIARMMQRTLAPHRYTGELSDSVDWRYEPRNQELRIGSDLQRGGRVHALSILERGTGGIPSLPFTPIAKWAAFKGLPAGPVWMSIKNKGVAPHPIMASLEARPEFQRTLNAGAKRIGTGLIVKALGRNQKVGL